MRTTILLDDDLYREAKKAATDSGCTFTQLLSDVLRQALARRTDESAAEEFVFPTFRGNGLRPGVDITNNAAVLDLLDEIDGPS